jgi:hypothetical protein
MRNKNWTKRYAECTISRDDTDITVCAWVYAGEPEQRYERYGSPPHPGSDPEVDIIESFDPLNGNEVTLTPQEESDAEEQLIEIAYEDTDE